MFSRTTSFNTADKILCHYMVLILVFVDSASATPTPTSTLLQTNCNLQTPDIGLSTATLNSIVVVAVVFATFAAYILTAFWIVRSKGAHKSTADGYEPLIDGGMESERV